MDEVTGVVPVQGEQVALVKEGGVYKVPVTLNGAVKLNFIVDTGASEVVMPMHVLLTLLDARTIGESDLLGARTYTLADGSKVENQRVRLRELKIGSRVIRDVTASVGDFRSSLLLGQTALEKLNPWRLDSRTHRLVLGDAAPASAAVGRGDHTQAFGKTLEGEPKSGWSAHRDEVFEVLERYLAESNDPDPARRVALYSQEVAYFDRGIVSRSDILKDKRAYRKRWPEAEYTYDGNMQFGLNENDEMLLSFDLKFRVYSPDRKQSISGRARNTLTLRRDGERVVIAGERGDVLERVKSGK